jgi:isopenicillin N synthase-like dioxygenase
MVMRLLGIALELEDPEYFVKCSKWIFDKSVPSFRTFRSLYYPAIPETVKIPEGKARVKEHSDFDFFTILFQDSMGGLEVFQLLTATQIISILDYYTLFSSIFHLKWN